MDFRPIPSATSVRLSEHIARAARAHLGGDRAEALRRYSAILPAINHENRQCGFRAAKAVMAEGKVFSSDFSRHPIAPLPSQTRAELLELLRPLDPVAMKWGH
ncbi:hypothetical protein BH23PSE1_BH23PSE1_07710 [soil metagenome]